MIPNPLSIGRGSEKAHTAQEDFLPLLCKARTCDATDPRDKVFALLPSLDDGAEEVFKDGLHQIY